MVFTVTLGNPSPGTVTVQYRTADGTATTDDYTAATHDTPITIDAGDTQAEISVPLTDDNIDEGVEFFTIELHTPIRAVLSSQHTASGYIIDDDGAPPPTLLTRTAPAPAPAAGAAAAATPAAQPTRFVDVDSSSVHAANIAAIAEAGITVGCSTQGPSYCPSQPVTRAQMASFLARALNLPPAAQPTRFVDVDSSSVHAANVAAIAEAGITVGCSTQGPSYCPSQPVTRAQMASFLARALNLPPAAQPTRFVDVDSSSVHAANVAAIAEAGITVGCSTQGPSYCPSQPVTRAQMASFLARALDL